MFERTRVAESKRASDCPLAERVRMCSLFSERSRAKYFLVLLLTPDVKENLFNSVGSREPSNHPTLHALRTALFIRRPGANEPARQLRRFSTTGA